MNLSQRDLNAFSTLRIPLELIEQAGIVRVTDRQARDEYGIRGGGDMAGIAFPYFEPSTMANGRRRRYVRIRRDFPEMKDGRPQKKYVAPYGDRKHFYFPPTPELFADNSVPVVLLESEKACLALTAWARRMDRKILPLAMGGYYGWRGRVGIKQTATGERAPDHDAIPDLNICCDGRKAYVLLDSNCRHRPEIQQGRASLVRQLRKQGADPLVIDLPAISSVNGPDDFVSLMGDEAFLKLLESAATGPPKTECAFSAKTSWR